MMRNIFLVVGIFFGLVLMVSTIQIYTDFIQYLLFIIVFAIMLVLINYLLKSLEIS